VGGTRYWISAQAIGSGPCLWEVQTSDVTGFPTAFRNPGGGISSCTAWTPMQSCLGSTPSDAAFRLFKTEEEAPVISCPGDTVIDILSGTGAVYTYNVTGTDNCAVDTIIRISGLPSGATHPVGNTNTGWIVYDAYGNSDTCTFTVTVNLVIGITEQDLQQVSLYPNPTDGKMMLTVTDVFRGAEIILLGIDGKTVKDLGVIENAGAMELDLSSLPQGFYFLELRQNGGRYFKKLIKN
jgi:hypothetical protein